MKEIMKYFMTLYKAYLVGYIKEGIKYSILGLLLGIPFSFISAVIIKRA